MENKNEQSLKSRNPQAELRTSINPDVNVLLSLIAHDVWVPIINAVERDLRLTIESLLHETVRNTVRDFVFNLGEMMENKIALYA
jgi:hypothetical protein